MTNGCADTTDKKASYRFDITFILIFLVFSVGGALYLYYLEYSEGLKNRLGVSILAWLGYTAIGLLILLFSSIRFLIRVFLPPRALNHILIKIAFVVLPFIVFYGSCEIITPAAPVFLKGFEKWAIKEVDINAIQQWLGIEGQRYEGQFYTYGFPSEFPACLTEFKPGYIRFDNSELDGTFYIEIGWGGMSTWGLRVGPPSMKTPEQGFLKIRDGYGENRRPVSPGAYVFTGG